MNLPNKITIFRMCMIPFFLVFFLVDTIPFHNWIALAIFIVACVSDAVDGHLARKHNLVTNFGKFMDPLADKLLVCTALLCFVEKGTLNLIVAVVIVAREFIISGFRTVAAEGGLVLAASYWGKSKTIAQMIMCCLLIVHLDFFIFPVLETIFIWVSFALTVISMLDYLIKNKSVLNVK
ncbi:MAG: CDP-diacylglycerol--glycerol-3-phosphate 3-phosphatidyltransferase [Lachnospiraceae bacterium]|nr:CDP-diacylglycerol--glycerol-3-phosphate 3-phosphatidyltransferase [Lachnospiraceae bacterium]